MDGHGDIGMTVLAPCQPFGGGHPITPYKDFNLGDNVYFLGFPFGLGSEVGGLNSAFTISWVKSGIVSVLASQAASCA